MFWHWELSKSHEKCYAQNSFIFIKFLKQRSEILYSGIWWCVSNSILQRKRRPKELHCLTGEVIRNYCASIELIYLYYWNLLISSVTVLNVLIPEIFKIFLYRHDNITHKFWYLIFIKNKKQQKKKCGLINLRKLVNGENIQKISLFFITPTNCHFSYLIKCSETCIIFTPSSIKYVVID
jgi:hypothetical protein